jgi:hypothetical protein
MYCWHTCSAVHMHTRARLHFFKSFAPAHLISRLLLVPLKLFAVLVGQVLGQVLLALELLVTELTLERA